MGGFLILWFKHYGPFFGPVQASSSAAFVYTNGTTVSIYVSSMGKAVVIV